MNTIWSQWLANHDWQISTLWVCSPNNEWHISRHYPSDNDHRAVTGRLPISHALQSFQPTHTQGTCTHFETDTNTIGELRYWQHCQLPARGRRGVREGSRLGDYPSPTWQSLPIMRTLQRFSTTSRSVGVKVRRWDDIRSKDSQILSGKQPLTHHLN